MGTRAGLDVVVGAGLALLAAVLYEPSTGHAFLNFDDDYYVSENPALAGGLSLGAVRWAFTTDFGGNWFPLTWLSYLVDAELHGLSSRGVHATNLLLHALCTAGAFAALRRLTGDRWRSALVAAVFALHPLQVEVVAWAAQRRALLAGLFWMLALWIYAGAFTRGAAEQGGLGRKRLGGLGLCVVAGLMSKPSYVTLPFVLLLLDLWPLGRLVAPDAPGRIDPERLRRCVVEKVPLFVLVALVSAITFVAQRGAGAVASAEQLSIVQRLLNVPVAYAGYLGHFLWPRDLAVYYPHGELGALRVIPSLVVLLALTIAVTRRLDTRPYWAVGWLWFLGTLVPMIGLVQVGSQAMADRYTYLATPGLTIVVAWSVPPGLMARPLGRALGALALAGLLGLGLATRSQLAHWRDSRSLFAHTVAVTGPNLRAQERLGAALLAEGEARAALSPLREALAIAPDDVPTLLNLSRALAAAGRGAQARREGLEAAQRAAALDPADPFAHETLADALEAVGRRAEAARAVARALEVLDADADPRRAHALRLRLRTLERRR